MGLALRVPFYLRGRVQAAAEVVRRIVPDGHEVRVEVEISCMEHAADRGTLVQSKWVDAKAKKPKDRNIRWDAPLASRVRVARRAGGGGFDPDVLDVHIYEVGKPRIVCMNEHRPLADQVATALRKSGAYMFKPKVEEVRRSIWDRPGN